MIRLIRIFGFLLIVAGAISIITWFIEPLRAIWPFLEAWFLSLPIAVRLGLTMAAIGFTLLLASIIWERLEDHTEGFRKSAQYLEWKDLLHHFYDPFPTVEHFHELPALSST